MYLEDVMSRVPRSPHSLQALLLSHTSSLDVPKLLFALLQLLLSAGVSGRPFDLQSSASTVTLVCLANVTSNKNILTKMKEIYRVGTCGIEKV